MGYSWKTYPLFTNFVTLCKHFKGPLQGPQIVNGTIAVLIVISQQKSIITAQLDEKHLGF